MPKQISEAQFEEHIQNYLLAHHNYTKRATSSYDKQYGLDREMLAQFLQTTQPKQWEALVEQHSEDFVQQAFSKRLAQQIESFGLLHVLRHGIKDQWVSVDLFYARPESDLNPDIAELFSKNTFSVMRQCKYSERNENSLDLVVFVNGIPLLTMELKTALTGQTVSDAIKQYKSDRDPKENILQFKRCMVHFAVDTDQVYMCTKLAGLKSRFLPFNKWNEGWAGNPTNSNSDEYNTSYLREDILSPETLSDLIKHFVIVQKETEHDENGKEKVKETQIFPRYHQLDVVRKVITDVQDKQSGKSYLVQHSAWSGKSNSIAWLSHRLVSLHNTNNEVIFDSVIIVTDRKVLDSQLQNTVTQFQHTKWVVQPIDGGSKQLREALEWWAKIIITTIQKFPYIVAEIGELRQQRFAVIIDEAHSSQTGETVKSLKQVLKNENLDEAEKQSEDEWEDIEDKIVAEMESRWRLENVSYFAFTATPKNKTLELFGTKQFDGQFRPFHLYSMRQAIEEWFIIDVLKNYTTFDVYRALLKQIMNDPQYKTSEAKKVLIKYVDQHKYTIRQKIEIIVQHFMNQARFKLGWKAKAMIVTKSRLHAVLYKIAIDVYLKEQGYGNTKALVAFSGTVLDPETNTEHTEANMNGVSEAQTKETFKKNEYKFLIVANKFQTGFDEPLLNVMYVDKKLGWVQAVQTLSRLNRVHPEKDEVFVLDFYNTSDDIKEAFQPYYEASVLSEWTDVNRLHDMRTKLLQLGLFGDEDIEAFAKVFFSNQPQQRLYAILSPILNRFDNREKEKKKETKQTVQQYARDYAFIAQIISFTDTSLEKTYVFCRYLAKKMRLDRDELPYEIVEDVDMEAFKIKKNWQGSIELEKWWAEPFDPMHPWGWGNVKKDEIDILSNIIKDLNDRFGKELNDIDRVKINAMTKKIDENEELHKIFLNNPKHKVYLEFSNHFDDEVLGIMQDWFEFYKKFADRPEISDYIKEKVFEYLWRKKVH